MIEADSLTKRYGDTTAVDGLSFRAEPGKITGFLGPNGAGKTTTMRMILGLDRPTGKELWTVDLAGTPTTGLRVQACGDAHLGNFRCFATPERQVIFDIHDLDETLPGPWEWDVKRLAASFVLACRSNGFSDKLARDAVLTCVQSYREAMARFSTMRALEVWYARFEADKLVVDIEDADTRARTQKSLAKAKKAP